MICRTSKCCLSIGQNNGKPKTGNQQRSSRVGGSSRKTNNRNSSNSSPKQTRKANQQANRSATQNSNNQRRTNNGASSGGDFGCPGSLDDCVGACVPLKNLGAYVACVKVCGTRCA